jgi:clan AA aspartic protease (TIGR02281 family)
MADTIHPRCLARVASKGCLGILGIAVLIVACLSPATAQEPKKLTKQVTLPEDVATLFQEHGLRLVGANLTLDLDNEFAKEVKELPHAKKLFLAAERDRMTAEGEVEQIKQRISELRMRHTMLSAQLANVTDVVSNNRIVGELNAIAGTIETLNDKQKQASENAKTHRSKCNEVREQFVQTLLDMGRKRDDAFRKWESLAADKSMTEAVDLASLEIGHELVLKPSSALLLADKQLKKYEEAVTSESLLLEKQGGYLWVDVALNNQPVEKMIVDPKASVLSISQDFADRLGIEAKKGDPSVVVSLADGRTIPGKLVKLASVRVGNFTAENVECVIMGDEAMQTRPLLGMSFLSEFQFDLDTAKSELKLVKVEAEDSEQSSGKLKKKGR